MRPLVYDAGVLIEADAGDRRIWAEHKLLLEAGFPPLVPTPVVARVSRGPKQANFRRLLRGCEIVAFQESSAHRVGALLARAGTADIVDAAVLVLAIERRAAVRTGDAGDLRQLARAANERVDVLEL